MVYYERVGTETDHHSPSGFIRFVVVGMEAGKKKLKRRSLRQTNKLHKATINHINGTCVPKKFRTVMTQHHPRHSGMVWETYEFATKKLNRGQSIRSYLKGKR